MNNRPLSEHRHTKPLNTATAAAAAQWTLGSTSSILIISSSYTHHYQRPNDWRQPNGTKRFS